MIRDFLVALVGAFTGSVIVYKIESDNLALFFSRKPTKEMLANAKAN